MISFRQFLGKYGIVLLPVSVETTVPGDILRKERRGYYPFGSMKNISRNAELDWNVQEIQANFTEENISRSLSLKGKYSLKSMGVNINGGLSKAKSATYTITGVKAKNLKSIDTFTIEKELSEIKSRSRSDWKRIKGNKLVELTFYATDFTIDFEVEGNFDLSAEVGSKVTHDIGAELVWKTKTSISISKNDRVPFGFKGLRIK